MACTNGLYATVTSGVHTKQSKELMQLYCVHGVCNGGVERRGTGNLRKFIEGMVEYQLWRIGGTPSKERFFPKRLYPEVRALGGDQYLKTTTHMKSVRSFRSTCIRRGLMAHTRTCGNWST
ncbi:unnamed protein product [Haemonchus placei]|uniref:TYR_PHOSPHATASE_2 domain-containing protein n=1 Tax=Haemonchus placei TaxID=6290 RepID=A0A0N4X820_HAEPC|nr:unnamed protein product [Haemonchus placei]